MRLAEALRGLLAATNDKAYRSPADQERVIEALAALAEYDAPPAVDHQHATVADQRAAFVDAMTWAVMP